MRVERAGSAPTPPAVSSRCLNTSADRAAERPRIWHAPPRHSPWAWRLSQTNAPARCEPPMTGSGRPFALATTSTRRGPPSSRPPSRGSSLPRPSHWQAPSALGFRRSPQPPGFITPQSVAPTSLRQTAARGAPFPIRFVPKSSGHARPSVAPSRRTSTRGARATDALLLVSRSPTATRICVGNTAFLGIAADFASGAGAASFAVQCLSYGSVRPRGQRTVDAGDSCWQLFTCAGC